MSQGPDNTRQSAPRHQRGYILIAVLTTLALLATVGYIIRVSGSVAANSVARNLESRTAQAAAEAGLNHAQWTLEQSSTCTGYTTLAGAIPNGDTYTVDIAPTSGSPVALQSIGDNTAGAAFSLNRTVRAYELPVTTVLQPGAAGIDTYLWDGAQKDTNFGITITMSVNNASAERTMLIKFDLSSIPAGAQIFRAIMELHLFENTGSVSNGVIDAHPASRTWVEGIYDDAEPGGPGEGATYRTYDGWEWWTTYGGDYYPNAVASVTIPTLAKGWYAWDISASAADWFAGSTPNNGLVLRASAGTVDKLEFASSDFPSANLHPKLTVTYACECGKTCVVASPPSNIVLSTASNASLGGLNFTDKDFAEYDIASDSATLLLDGTALGIGEDPDAVHILANGHILLSTINTVTLGGLTFENEDLIDYDPVTDTATMVFDGSERFTAGSTDLSAAHILANGKLVLSNEYAATLGGLSFESGDLIIYDLATDVATLLLDASDVGLSGWIDAVHVLDNGHIVLSSSESDSVGGLDFNAGDLVAYDPVSDTAQLYFDGSLFSASENVRSSHIGPGSGVIGVAQKNLLMVVVDPTSLTAQEAAKKSLIEGWGYTVALIDEDDSQTDYDAAIADNNVAFISEDVASGSVGNKLVNAAIGVVTEEDNLSDEFGLASAIGWESGTQLEINDNTHDITKNFTLGLLTVLTTSESLAYVSGTLSPALGQLASSTSGYALVTLDSGAQTYSGGSSAGRRVQLPWGGNDMDVSSLNSDGLKIFQRALKWASESPALLPIAHWKLDDGIGNTATDSQGGHHGTLNNAPSWVAGQLGDALNFDGSDDYVDLTSDAELDDLFDNGATVMAWIKPAGWGGNGYGRIFDKSSDPSNTGDGWVIRMNVDNGGVINFGQGFSSNRGWWKIPNGSVGLDAWLHIAVAYDASSTTNDPLIYLNGTSVVVTEVDTPSGTLNSDEGEDLRLGNHAGGTSHTFDGIIDDARIYDRMLTADEIADIVVAGGGGAPSGPSGGGCSVGTYKDNFDSISFGGNNGTLTWSTDWLELGESDGANSNDVAVLNDESNYQLQIRDNDNGGEGVEREADLSAATSATLSFDYRRDALDNANDYVAVYVSATGTAGPYTELVRFEGNATDVGYQFYNQSISSYISANTAIRILGSSNLGGGDEVWFDNIEICLD